MTTMFRTPPTLDDLRSYAVNRQGQFEVIQEARYDTVTYDGAAGQNVLTGFVSIDSKTLDDTNMEAAGNMPSPQFFLIQAIEIMPFPGVTIAAGGQADDIYTIQQNGHVILRIGSKDYLREAPQGVFPPKTCLKTDVAGVVGAEYAQLSGRPYILSTPLLLEPTQNFRLTLAWDTPVPLPSGQDASIKLRLDGLLYRESQ